MLLAEAGTGTGKTFAYLVPALLSGLKTIVSTGTRALQDQLYHRDLPRVRDALGTGRQDRAAEGPRELPLPLPHRARQGRAALHHARAGDAVPAHRRLERAHAPGRSRRTGGAARGLAAAADGDVDRGELPRQRMPVLGRLLRGAGAAARADRRHRRGQPSSAARRPRAQAGRVRRDPARRAGVRDRRSAPAAGTRRAVLRRRLVGATAGRTRARRAGRMQGRRKARWRSVQAPARDLEHATRALRAAMEPLPPRGTQFRALQDAGVRDALDGAGDGAVAVCAKRSRRCAKPAPGFEACHARAQDQHARLARWLRGARRRRRALDDARTSDVRWYELSPARLPPAAHAARRLGAAARAPRALACGVGVHFGDARGRRPLRPRRAAPRPRRSAHAAAAESVRLATPGAVLPAAATCRNRTRATTPPPIADALRPVLRASAGRAFLLFASHRALREAAETLRGGRGRCSCRARRRAHVLLQRFRESGNGVLLGAASFREGVDVVGDALSAWW